MIELAKPALDVGLYTNQREAQLEFWQQRIGLPFSEVLPVGAGVHQLRHTIGDSILKINHAREALAQTAPSGIRELTIATAGLDAEQSLEDPDGNRVRLVPPGLEGVEQLRVDLTVSNVPAHEKFYGEVLGLPAGAAAGTFLCGASQLRLSEGAATADPEQRAIGYRYLTVQVFDVKQTHASVLAAGGREGRAPIRLGDVAHISFIRDPDGNWIEISQRKSITGSLD